MKYFKISVLVFLFCQSLSVNLISQDVLRFFPLQVGNVWVYNGEAIAGGLGCFLIFYQKMNIDSSKTFYGKVYFKFNVQTHIISGQGPCMYSFIQNDYCRVDSVSGNIYKFVPGYTECLLTLYERLVDSLKSRRLDTAYTCFSGTYHPEKRLADTLDYTFLNFSLKSKRFSGPVISIDYFYNNRYSKDFGLVSYGNVGPNFYSTCNLKGCIIGGVLYGDTSFSIIGINQFSSEVPSDFGLHQNYPNPFNPSTQIKFDIPQTSPVSLLIYDAAGREVARLINEKLNSGTYSYDWDASNFPSGIYFYKLTAGDFIQTRKMVLIK